MTMSRRTFIGTVLAGVMVPSSGGAKAGKVADNQEPTEMRVRFTFNDLTTMSAVLYENPSALDFFSMLPLDLTISNFGPNEKIAYLPRKLTDVGRGVFGNEQPYDLCYYMPWGNLAMFYADYKHPGLIRLGRFEEGFEALHVDGEYPLRIEAM